LGRANLVGYPFRVPSLFRRKPTDAVEGAIAGRQDSGARTSGAARSAATKPGGDRAGGRPGTARVDTAKAGTAKAGTAKAPADTVKAGAGKSSSVAPASSGGGDGADADAAKTSRRGYTPKKGKITPKRRDAQARRVEPPANRREAMKRQRAKAREERIRVREGMRSGNPEYLMKRDQGEERALIRDIVDSRRNLGPWFYGSAIVVLAASFGRASLQSQVILNIFWSLSMAVILIDFAFLSRRVGRLLRERYPKSTVPMFRQYVYACFRSINPRMMRMPRPRVKIREKI
jgi:Protein of unknown function (DUF3043)